jgi:hypothetical protein
VGLSQFVYETKVFVIAALDQPKRLPSPAKSKSIERQINQQWRLKCIVQNAVISPPQIVSDSVPVVASRWMT